MSTLTKKDREFLRAVGIDPESLRDKNRLLYKISIARRDHLYAVLNKGRVLQYYPTFRKALNAYGRLTDMLAELEKPPDAPPDLIMYTRRHERADNTKATGEGRARVLSGQGGGRESRRPPIRLRQQGRSTHRAVEFTAGAQRTFKEY